MTRASRSRSRSALLLAFTASSIAFAGCESDGDAAETDAAAEQAVPDQAAIQEQMALMGELQSIDQALTPIRQEAMADPELRAQEQALVARVESAIEAAHPELAGAEARFDSLRTAYETAQAEGDTASVQAIAGDLQGLQTAMQQAQGEVLQQEEITDAVEEFRENLFARMREMDPRADSLLDLAEEISDRLEETAGDGEGGG